MASTHPICTDIQSTDQAESLFDGISYGKGSAFLKQWYAVLGHEGLKKGLKTYFAKHAWGNTTLPDFVDALQQAWDESPDSIMGPDFQLTEWAHQWLFSSGINILEPVATYDSEGVLTGLSVKQTMGLRGANRLRKQKISVALFNDAGNMFRVPNVVLSEKEEVTVVTGLPEGWKVAAIYLNEGLDGYAKVRFDAKSVAWLTANLDRVADPVTRGAVWRYMHLLVMDR